MKYFSTRGGVSGISFQDAVMMGMAEDGGLLLPEFFPQIEGELEGLRGKSYSEVAFAVIEKYVGDIPADVLRDLINKSYATFDCPETIPVVKLNGCYLAELYHGPTYAFKDVALQLLGNLFEYILTSRGERLNIIGATSGDTGSAAIYGVRGKKNIKIAVLYPNGRISPVQELQMATVDNPNVYTFAVEGTFDDCQKIVKNLFSDIEFKKRYNLGAVNSINWARIMAQIVYYFYAYLLLPDKGPVNFVIPTGNFGNIFAGYCAKRMGLPVDKLVLATNENNILHRFISSGDYSLRDVVPTHSPSMDIQLASNLERYLYFLYDGDTQKLINAQAQLKSEGVIRFSSEEMHKVRSEFFSYDADNLTVESTIRRVYDQSEYVIEPHTACGVAAAYRLGLGPENTIAFATAHPGKFPEVVHKVLSFYPDEPDGIKKLHTLALRKELAPNDEKRIKDSLLKVFS